MFDVDVEDRDLEAIEGAPSLGVSCSGAMALERRDLSDGKARQIEEPSHAVIPDILQELSGRSDNGVQRPVLMEVARVPNSPLTQAVHEDQTKGGSSSNSRPLTQEGFAQAEAWWTTVSDNHWDETAADFWTDEEAPQSPSRLRCLTATVVGRHSTRTRVDTPLVHSNVERWR